MEHKTENYELQRCRDYEAELMECEKANLFLREEVERLAHQVEEYKECIVRMSVARYMKNETTH